MGLRDTLRRRFDVPLESHQIEEDYTGPAPRVGRSHLALSLSQLAAHERRTLTSMPPPRYQEEVPLYEASQAEHDLAPLLLHLLIQLPPPPRRRQDHGQRLQRIKQLGLKFLNARQHMVLALCRDILLIPPIVGLCQLWLRVFFHNYYDDPVLRNSLTQARELEHFLTGTWCIVLAYLTYLVIDGLLVRWIVTYLTLAAIVRVLLMLMLLIALEQYLVLTFSAQGYQYGLHIWLLISCGLTALYIGQTFVTLNIDVKGKKRRRFFDFYKIAVFGVLPVGIALFISMIVLLRSLLILRIDIDAVKHHWTDSTGPGGQP